MKTITLKILRIKFVMVALIVISFKGYSQTGDYFSLQNGDFLDYNSWGYNSQIENCGCIPDDDGICNITIPANKTVYVRHALNTSCNMHIGANSILIVESNGSLTLYGPASMIGDGLFQIDSGAIVNIGRNLDLTGNATVINNGFLTIGEDLTFEGSSLLCGTGVLDVIGNIIGGAPCASMSVLPIELTYFKGTLNQNTVELIWETASEINNDFFEIEKSMNGIDYTLVKRIDSKAINGNSSLNLKYLIIDEFPYQGISYYRLKQTDLDRQYKYSSTISIDFSKKAFDVTFFPNPNKGELFVQYTSTDNINAILILKNTMDKIVYSKDLELNFINSNTALDIPDEIASGIYYCTLLIDNKSYTQKIILLPK